MKKDLGENNLIDKSLTAGCEILTLRETVSA